MLKIILILSKGEIHRTELLYRDAHSVPVGAVNFHLPLSKSRKTGYKSSYYPPGIIEQ
jgi:hypothetical protein